MDPEHFQISLENWPAGLLEDIRVLVADEEFSCEELFPDQYPDRIYCWGLAPPSGIEVVIRVFLPHNTAPTLEIPIVVPIQVEDSKLW